MKKPQLIIENMDTWRLTGALVFNTVTALLAEIHQQSAKPKVLILREVTHIDSAGLALLLELRKQYATLLFQHVPSRLFKLAKINGVEDLL